MKFSKIAIVSVVLALLIPTVPLAFACIPGPGKVTGGGQCIVDDITKEIPSASFGFNAMMTKDGVKGEINYVDHNTKQKVHVHDVNYIFVWEEESGNKPYPMRKAVFGGPDVYSEGQVDVYVEDNGEPGKNDRFLIFLDGVYLGGSGDATEQFSYENLFTEERILAGNIQIHKPMPGT